MSGNILILKGVVYLSTICMVIVLSAALFFNPPILGPAIQTAEPKQAPQVIFIMLCGVVRGTAVTSYPLTWTDGHTPKTPEFTELAKQAIRAGDVYEFDTGSEEVCAKLDLPREYQASR